MDFTKPIDQIFIKLWGYSYVSKAYYLGGEKMLMYANIIPVIEMKDFDLTKQ